MQLLLLHAPSKYVIHVAYVGLPKIFQVVLDDTRNCVLLSRHRSFLSSQQLSHHTKEDESITTSSIVWTN